MKRQFVELDKVTIYNEFHQLIDGELWVDEFRDGKSTEEHLEGIAYVKGVLKQGAKIMPILVLDREDGTYELLDGFKRAVAQQELGFKYVEAFICSQKEYQNTEEIPFLDYKIRAMKGGQMKEHFKLLEGLEQEDFNYSNVLFLYNSPRADGLKIEIADNVHIHWGRFGQYRLNLGREDFIKLAQAIGKI